MARAAAKDLVADALAVAVVTAVTAISRSHGKDFSQRGRVVEQLPPFLADLLPG
jgi:hypothetical protein